MTGAHDRFFRYIFNHPARAEALLRHNLPVQLVAEVDWSTLRRESGTLVDWQRETRNDLLFSARYLHSAEDDPPHFFPIEHQSTVYRWMALRSHDYSWRLIQHWLELNPRSRWIPEVTALVVYPRQGRSWSAPLRLEDHYRVPTGIAGIRRRDLWTLRSEYRVDDLSIQSEQEVLARSGPPLVSLGLLVLSFAGHEELAERLPHWSELFARVHASHRGRQQLYRVARYLHHLGDERAHEEMKGVLHSIMEAEQAEAFMRTMAEVLKEQGRQQGLAEGEARGEAKGLARGEAQGEAKGLARGEAQGEAKGLAKALLRLLAARGVHVDESSRQRIQACMDAPTLERWLERALNSTSLSEVLGGPAQ